MAMAARREERSFPPGYPAPPMSVTHVRMKYRRELGLCLNATSGLTNDWKILADALGFKVEEIDEIERKGRYGSPTEILLTDAAIKLPRLTVDDLIAMLQEMERPDAIEVLEKAKSVYIQSVSPSNSSSSDLPPPYTVQQNGSSESPPPADPFRGGSEDLTHLHSNGSISPLVPRHFESYHDFPSEDKSESPPLVPRSQAREMVNQGLQQFDVFLAYARDEDFQLVSEIRMRLEENDISVFDYEAQSPIGHNKCQYMADMVVERCRKSIIILSPKFVKSKWCNFVASLAHSKSPDARRHVLIPIVYEKCKIPNYLSSLYHLDYTRFRESAKDLEEFFWKRLFNSIHV